MQKEIIESIENKIQKCKQQLCEIQMIEAETPATLDQFFNSMCEKVTAYSQGSLDYNCRVSMAYDSPTFICAQNLVWPQKPDYHNPIVAICHKAQYTRFNFKLRNGESTNINSDVELQVETFDPDRVSTVVLWYVRLTALLAAIELIDAKGEHLIRVGDFHSECRKHEIKLKSGERLVGMQSFTTILAFHNKF